MKKYKQKKLKKGSKRIAESSDDSTCNPSLDIDYPESNDGEDNRAADGTNQGKLSTAPIHTEFPRLRWNEDDRETAKQMGLKVKNGHFTKEEDIILTNNWFQLCDDFPVYQSHLVLGYYGYNDDTDLDEKMAAREIIKRSEMYFRLAKGLPERPLYKVYQRARKLFSGLNKSQNLTKDEKKRIIELGRMGFKKRQIASQFFADVKTVEDVLRRNINPHNKAFYKKCKWTEEDNKKLNNIIQTIITQKNITDSSEIPWSHVATLMSDRSDTAIRDHFYSVQFFKVYDSNGMIKEWDFNETQKLVYFLYKKDYENESDIDWDEVKEKFLDFRFWQLTKKWRTLRAKYEDYPPVTYKELIQRLYDKYVETRSNIEELEKFVENNDLF